MVLSTNSVGASGWAFYEHQIAANGRQEFASKSKPAQVVIDAQRENINRKVANLRPSFEICSNVMIDDPSN